MRPTTRCLMALYDKAWHSTTRHGRTVGTVAIFELGLPAAHPANTGADGSTGRSVNWGNCARGLRTDRCSGGDTGIDCPAWQSVRVGTADEELPNWRSPGRRTRASGQKRGLTECSQPSFEQV